MRTKRTKPRTEAEKELAFYGLPFAGNHTDIGPIDAFNTLCLVHDAGEPFYFSRDESWDNVEYVGTDSGERFARDLARA